MRAFLRVLLLAVAPVLVVVVPGAAPTHACECESTPLADLAERADVAFTGVVLEDPAGEPGELAFRVRVQRVYAGTVPEVVQVGSPSEESSCGLGVAEGDRWLFLADENYEVWSCDGSRSIADDDIAQVEAVIGPGGPPEPGGVAPPDTGEESEVANVVTRLLVGLVLVFVGAAAVLLLLMLRGWARDQR